MQLQGLKFVFRKQKVCCSSYQARCVCQWPVIFILSLVCIITATTPYFTTNQNMDLMSIITGHGIPNSKGKHVHILHVVIVLVWALCGFVSVWLAGWKYKLQSIITLGISAIGFGVFLDVLVSVILLATGTSELIVWVAVFDYVSATLAILGYWSVISNTLQLAIEQIPEASAAQLSAIVSWFVFCSSLGLWLNPAVTDIFESCIVTSEHTRQTYVPVLKLIFAAFIALSISAYYLQKHNFLDNSPTSNTSRKIFKVLKYAYKHKQPQRRSAMTYWEEEPVPRLCYGKRKYGGPFSNEEVEDVRTFIRISVLLAVVFIYMGFIYLHMYSFNIFDDKSESNNTLPEADYNKKDRCTRSIIFHFTSTNNWWLWLFAAVYEVILVPVLSYQMPNIIRRLSFTGVGFVILAFVILTIVAVKYFSSAISPSYLLGLAIGLSLMEGLLMSLFFISIIEFICAQTPYAMRNYFVGVTLWSSWSSNLFAGIVFSSLRRICDNETCLFVYAIVTFSFCIIGLTLYSICVIRYRKRSRGQEDEHQQRWVEETYGRYVAEDII